MFHRVTRALPAFSKRASAPVAEAPAETCRPPHLRVSDLFGDAPGTAPAEAFLHGIAALAPLELCLATFEGFAQLAEAEAANPSRATLAYPTMGLREWVRTCNERVAPMPTLGCLFTTQACLYGAGQVLVAGALLVEDTGEAEVAKAWHARDLSALGARQVVEIPEKALSFVGPGHKVYGHWLVDFLPRLFVAHALLGERLREFTLLLPHTTPAFALRLCALFFGRGLRIRHYDEDAEFLVCRQLCIPTSPVSRNHHFHPRLAALYAPHRAPRTGHRKLCLSRKRVEGTTPGVVKAFSQWALFEATAVSHGYEIVHPETLAFDAQFALFRQARVLVGEFGSAMHNSVFAGPDTIVGAAGFFNEIQLRLCALSDQIALHLIPDSEHYVDRVLHYASNPVAIAEFFQAIEVSLAEAG